MYFKISTQNIKSFAFGSWEERKWLRVLVGNNEDTSSNPQHLHKEPGMAVRPLMPALKNRERCVDAFYDKDSGLQVA